MPVERERRIDERAKHRTRDFVRFLVAAVPGPDVQGERVLLACLGCRGMVGKNVLAERHIRERRLARRLIEDLPPPRKVASGASAESAPRIAARNDVAECMVAFCKKFVARIRMPARRSRALTNRYRPSAISPPFARRRRTGASLRCGFRGSAPCHTSMEVSSSRLRSPRIRFGVISRSSSIPTAFV